MHCRHRLSTLVSIIALLLTIVGCGTYVAPTSAPQTPTRVVSVPTATVVPRTEAAATATAERIPTSLAPTRTAATEETKTTSLPTPTAAAATATSLPTQERPGATPSATGTTPPSPAPAATATNTRPPLPTIPPTPTFTPLPAPTSTVVANLTGQIRSSLPTPPATPGPGNLSLNAVTLQSPFGDNLWVVHTVGLRSFNPPYNHFIGIYRQTANGWQELSKAELTCPDYLNYGSVKQVTVEPSQIWIEVDGGAGAHSGCFDLFSFDDKTLKRQASNTYASPGAGRVADLFGDGMGEVILEKSDPYVFCYACGVRYAAFKVLRWNGSSLAEVQLMPLSDTLPADVRNLNNRAITLAQGGLWKDAQAAISQTLTLATQVPTVTMNAALINLTATAQAKNITGGYPLLGYLFYGDYDGALNLLRAFKPEQLFAIPSPLVTGTVAMGWEKNVTQWITQTTTLALSVQPDLAAAYFIRGWGLNLTEPGSPAAVADIQKAAQLNPTEALFAQSVAYFKK